MVIWRWHYSRWILFLPIRIMKILSKSILLLLLLLSPAFAENIRSIPPNKAKYIKIEDTGDYYTGTNTETALQEIGAGTTTGWISDGTNATTLLNVGIGITAPTSLLHVAGNANISGLLTAGTLSGDLSFLNITSGTNASAQMVINTGSALTRSGTGSIDASLLQNATWGAPLAIGTTTPSTGTFTVLTADTSTSTTLFVNTLSGILKAASGLVGIGTSGTDYYNASVQIDHDATTNFVATEHIDWTNATNNLLTTGNITGSTIAGAFLTVTGNVGIGTTNPLGLLVAGTSVGTPSLFVSTGGNVGIGTTSVSKRLNVGGDMDVMGIIYAQSVEQYSVTGNIGAQGNLGIGTTAPIFKLQVIGSGTDRFVFTGGNFGIGITAPTGLLQVGTTPGAPILFVNNANVGIGKTAPSTALEVVGTITADSIASGALLVAGTDVGANLDTAYTHSQDNTQAHSDYLLNNDNDTTSGIITSAGLITTGTTSSGNLFVTSNVGIGTTNPIYNLQVAGTTASATLHFGTAYNNILPAGTGANNQILKTNASGVITWQNDNDTGASGVQSVAAVLPLTSSGGTAPSIALTIDSGMFDTGVSGELIIKDAGIDLTSKVAGTLPAANIAILPLSTHVSGTLPAASMAIVNLAGGVSVVSGTLPSANVAILPLSTHVSGTLPDASSPLNITNTSIITGTIKTGDTVPLYSLAIYNPDSSFDGIGKVLSNQKTIKVTNAYSYITAGTNVVFTLKVGASGTGPYGNLLVGSTATTTPLAITSFLLDGTVPAGQLLILDTLSTLGAGTNTMFNLSILGREN